MEKQEPPAVKKWQAISAILILGAFALLVGWGWWNEMGPFAKKKTVEINDPMEGIEYISPYVWDRGFTNLDNALQWAAMDTSADKFSFDSDFQPYGRKAKVQSLTPYFFQDMRDRSPLAQKKIRERAKRRQSLTNSLSDVVLTEGFHLLPYKTSQRASVDLLSRAEMMTDIKACKQGKDVVFQIETTLTRHVRARLKKNTLVKITVYSAFSQCYIIEEKDAEKAIKNIALYQARKAIRRTRRQQVIPEDAQQELPLNPEDISESFNR